jgi:glycosyltransferase involved in cell wall biosynthesis
MKIITVSEFSKARLAHGLDISPDKIVVIPNGVRPPGGTVTLAPADQVLADKIGGPFLLSVGSLEPRKNIGRLLEAWRICSASKAYRLVIAGERRGNFARVQNLDGCESVIFLGRISDKLLDTLLCRAEALVFPSQYEGFGLPPLEAMIRGTPVLLSRATSLPEVGGIEFSASDDNRGAVLYFDPLDTRSIAEAIDGFVGLPSESRGRLAENARRRASEFTWDKAAAATWEVFESIR